MRTAKEISIISVFVALLIGGQFILSAVSGIEIVTVLSVAFFFCFGVVRGCIVATSFSLIRCFLFGFFPNVVILYLVYYNLLALSFGLLGVAFHKKVDFKKFVVVIFLAVVMTVAFTMLDNLITPAFYGFTLKAKKAYFIASLATMIPQVICALATVSLLFYPLYKIFKTIKI